MSHIIPAGIDFGSLYTVSSIFKVNSENPKNSSVDIVADRNGMKEPSSQLFFSRGDRFSATAANLRSDKDPDNCIQFIKASIRKPFDEVTDDVKKIVRSIRSDKDGNVEYVLHLDQEEKHFWPSHLAGIYLADRIQDIMAYSQDDNKEDYNIVISVPHYFTDDQIRDFEAGLQVANVNQYVLISEVDAVALEYGYFRNLHNEFDAAPMVVLFVGVGFSEAQAFAVKYSKDKYEIISYEHTSEVNSSKLDTLVKELACNAFEEGSDPDYDGQLDYDGYMLFNNFKDFLNAKIQLSNPDNDYVEINLHDYDDQHSEFAVEVYSDAFNEAIDNSGILESFAEMIRKCVTPCIEQGLSIASIELCDDGIRSLRFRETVNNVLAEFGLSIEMNTRRVISECISRGNAEYAFYNAYLDNEGMSPIVSKLAQYVKPIAITSPNSHVKTLLRSSSTQENQALIESALLLEKDLKKKQEDARRLEVSRNEFQKALGAVRSKIYDEKIIVSENLYHINEIRLLDIIDEYNKIYREKEGLTAEFLNNLIAEFNNKVKEEMIDFEAKYLEEQRELERERQLAEKLRREKEERERVLRIQKEREEKLLKIAIYKELLIKHFLSSSCLSSVEKEYLSHYITLVQDPEFNPSTLPSICQFENRVGMMGMNRYGGGGGGMYESYYSNNHRHYDEEDEDDYIPPSSNRGFFPSSSKHDLLRRKSGRGNMGSYFSTGPYYEKEFGLVPEMVTPVLMADVATYVPIVTISKEPEVSIQVYNKQILCSNPPKFVNVSNTNTPAIIHSSSIQPVVVSTEDLYKELHVKQLIRLNGNRYYYGYLRNGIPEGEGEIFEGFSNDNGIWVSGSLLSEGEYRQGQLTGSGRMYCENILCSEGEYWKNQLIRGVVIMKNKARLIGEFDNGKLHGSGKFVLPCGLYIEGEWSHGQPDGMMKYHLPDGYEVYCDMNETQCMFELLDTCLYYHEEKDHFGCDCLFYYDGSIFLGEVEKKDMTPSRGSFYLLSNNGFIKTVIGESCSTCHVKDISLSGVYRSGIVKLQFTY